MSMSKEEIRELRRIYSALRELPAFDGVIFRRCKLNGLYGMVKTTNKGKKVVFLSSEMNFTDTIHTLAHECAHILVDMDNRHNEVFNIMQAAMEKIIRMLLYA